MKAAELHGNLTQAQRLEVIYSSMMLTITFQKFSWVYDANLAKALLSCV
jgi:hypothetical protein